MKLYTLSDVFGFAVKIEERGEQFYRAALEYVRGDDAYKLFSLFARQEAAHAKVFLHFANKYSKDQNVFYEDEQVKQYLEVIIEGLFFPSRLSVEEMLNKTLNESKLDYILSLVSIAINLEAKTILFYQKLQEIIDKKGIKDGLQKIIIEEERHLRKLKKMIETLGVSALDMNF